MFLNGVAFRMNVRPTNHLDFAAPENGVLTCLKSVTKAEIIGSQLDGKQMTSRSPNIITIPATVRRMNL